MDMLLLGGAIAVMLLSLSRLVPLVRRNKIMFGRYFPPGGPRRVDAAAELPQWPIPGWWPNGKCACPGCQIDARVRHTCGGTEVWETCDCRPAKTGRARS